MKSFAFYLPQFHPIPENDSWWGAGFTEWRNVVLSKPRFSGHRQPQLPADLGFYDLRLPETLSAQAALAAECGLDGFCVYHYWFHGKRMLSAPIDKVISTPEVKFPFFLCWANETWTRAWDGQERSVLVAQTYSDADDVRHAAVLSDLFADERYQCIDGKALFVLYRPASHPNLQRFRDLLCAAAIKAGRTGIYLMGCQTGFSDGSEEDRCKSVLDAVVDFQPNRACFPAPSGVKQSLIHTSRRILPSAFYELVKRKASVVKRVDYDGVVAEVVSRYAKFDAKMVPCVFPSWDNSPRRRTPTVIQNSSSESFRHWVAAAKDLAQSRSSNNLLFINAWNEWAEGCHLEPDLEMGAAFMSAVRAVLRG